MSDSESERQRKLKAGRAKLMEFKQMKKRKKKEEAAASASANSSRSTSGSVKKDTPKAASNNTSQAGDQDTENDAVSLSSATGSQAGSPIPHDGADNSNTSGSEYTSGDESYSTDDGGVDSLVIANLERNEYKSRVIELEENLRGKQAVLKELNKENFELRAKLHNFESGSRQESSPSPILKRELDSLQDTLRANQKKLEEINVENQEMRAKLAQTGHEDKSVVSKVEELKLSLESKQQMLEALNQQNEELAKENKQLKVRSRERSPDSSHSDSQVESLQENLKTKQSILTELNRQNQELREKLSEAPTMSSDQVEKFERRISDLQSELTLKDDELEKLKAIQVSFLQTKEVLKEVSLQSKQAREELEVSQNRHLAFQTESQIKHEQLLERATMFENQLEKLQTEYHSIVAINNDGLMKIQILESQIASINEELDNKNKKIKEMDTQVLLAVGERDAVQLEARTQVEDFEERVKEMRDQLQMNDVAVREYESKITSASEDLVKAKDLVVESEEMLEKKNKEISFLQNKVETLEGSGDLVSKEREIYQHEIENMKIGAEKKQNEVDELRAELDRVRKHCDETVEGKEQNIAELERRVIDEEQTHAAEIEKMETTYLEITEKRQLDSHDLLRSEKEKWEIEANEKLVEVENEYRRKMEELKEKLVEDIKKESSEEFEIKMKTLEENYESKYNDINAELEVSKTKVVELENRLSDKENQLSVLTEDMKTQTENAEQAKSEIENALEEKEAKLSELSRSLEESSAELNSKITEFDVQQTKFEESAKDSTLQLHEKTTELDEVKKLLDKKESRLDLMLEELEVFKVKNRTLEEEVTVLKDSFEREKLELEQRHKEKLRTAEMELLNSSNVMEETRKSEEMLLREDYNKLKDLLEEKLGSEDKLTNEVSSLLEKNKAVSCEKEELIGHMNQLKIEKEDLEKSCEEKINAISSLEKEVASLLEKNKTVSCEKEELIEHMNQLKIEKEDLKKSCEEKTNVNSALEKDIKELLKKNKTVSCEKEELTEHTNQLKIEKEDLEKSCEEKINTNFALEKEVEALELVRKELASENLKLLQSEEENEKVFYEKSKSEKALKEECKRLQDEKNDACLEYDAEIRTLKERLDLVSQEHNAETVALFNLNLVKLESEKNEQIQTLKEEISHQKESFEKQIHKLQSDYESDSKHIDDDNQRLKLELKALKEYSERDKVSTESNAKMEVDKLIENHRLDLAKMKEDLSRRYEEEKLELKESNWKQLKEFEMERELEVKNLIAENEKIRKEELEILRQELEEAKHKEVHDVVCSMTKDQKESAALLRENLEEQLRKVQAQRDQELSNIQQEYQSYKVMKKDEMEEMLTSQIARYEEEQSTLQKRLNEAEEHIHILSNERDGMLNDLAKKDAVIKEEQSGRAAVEEDLSSLKAENKQLRKAFEETVSELGRFDNKEQKTKEELLPKDEVDAKTVSVEEEKMQRSNVDSFYEDSERLLDEELKNVTKLCKEQIAELTEKLNAATARAEEIENKFDESLCLNEGLSQELQVLRDELNISKQELETVTELNENLAHKSLLNTEHLETEDDELTNLHKMSEQAAALSAEIESKKKEKAELDASLTDVFSQIEDAQKKSSTLKSVVVEEDIQIADASTEEAWIMPEVLQELAMTPVSLVEDYEPDQATAGDLEIKHLQSMLVENNEKLELQKQEIKMLQDALESERALFAEQLRVRKAKDMELGSANGDLSNEDIMRDNRDLISKLLIVEQRLKEKEQSEGELRDENWKLVNLLKDNNIQLFTEKESLQDQLVKQEEIIEELQLQMSTSDLVTTDIQEAFGRQMAALHRQRDALLDQLEQHKNDHQGFAKIVQEKAALEDRLREERAMLSEKLKQKEALEMELAAERAVLHEKIIELEKLRENLNGKAKLASELADQRDDLRMELNAIEERLITKEESLSLQRVELERELQLKDLELLKWEDDFKSRELEFMQNEDALRQNFGEALESTRTNLERRYEEGLGQLRCDLDADYMDRMHLLENGLHEQYGQQLTRLRDDHQEQLKNWLELSDWLLESLLTLPCFKINRAKSGFEERLLDLRRQLEEERHRQVRTVKRVLEREHSSEIMDLESGHSSEIEDVKSELIRDHQLEIEALKRSFQATHQNALEELQSSLMTESAIQLAAVRLQAEIDAAAQLEKMQAEVNAKVDEKIRQMQSEQEKAVEQRTAKQKMDAVIREIKLKLSDESEDIADDTAEELQILQIRSLEDQLLNRHNEELRQAEIDLAARYDQEMDRLKYEITQKHGDDMFVVMSEFEAEQENYFKERLGYIQEEHENEMKLLSHEHELLLIKTKNELDLLREEDFQRIRKLQDEIYSKEEAILELKIALDAEKDDIQKKVERKLSESAKDVFVKSENSQSERENRDFKAKFEKALMDIEELKNDFERKLTDEKEIWQIQHAREIEMVENDFEIRFMDEQETLQRIHDREINNLQATLQKAVMEKEFAETDFERRLQDRLNEVVNEKEIWRMEHDREVADLKAGFEKAMLENNCEHEEKYQELRSHYENQSVIKDVDYIKKEEEVKLEVEKNQWVCDENLQSEMQRLEKLHEEQLKEQDRRHREELEEAVVQLSSNLKSDFNSIMFDMKNRYEAEKEDLRKEFLEKEDIELGLLTRQLHSEFDDRLAATREEWEQVKLAEIAQVTTQLSLKNAIELENRKDNISRKYEKELDAVKKEMQRDFSRNALRQAAEIEDLESQHAKEVRGIKAKYDKLLAEKMIQPKTEDSQRSAFSLADQIEDLKMRHAEELRSVKADYERQLQERTQESQSGGFSWQGLTNRTEIEDLKMKHAEELRSVKADCERQLQERSQRPQSVGFPWQGLSNQTEIEDLKMKHAEELRSVKADYERQLQERTQRPQSEGFSWQGLSNQTEIEDLKMRHAEELRSVKADYERQLQERKQEPQPGGFPWQGLSNQTEIEDLNMRHAEELRSVKADYEKQLQERKQEPQSEGFSWQGLSNQTEIEDLKMKHAEELRSVKANYERQPQERIQESQSGGFSWQGLSNQTEIEDLKMKHAEELRSVKADYERQLQERTQESQSGGFPWQGLSNQTEIEDLKMRHAEELRSVKADHEKLLQERTQRPQSEGFSWEELSNQTEIVDLKLRHAEELRSVKADCERQLQERKQEPQSEGFSSQGLSNQTEIEDLKLRHAEELRSVKADCEKLLQEKTQRPQSGGFSWQGLSYQTETEEIKIKQAEELRSVNADYGDFSKEKRIEEIPRGAFDDEIEDLKTRHTEELNKVKEKYEQLLQERTQQLQTGDLSGNIFPLSPDVDDIALSAARRIKELETRHTEELNKVKEKYEQLLQERTQQLQTGDLSGNTFPLSPDVDDIALSAARRIKELETRHTEELKRVKNNYDQLLQERTQELQTEVNLLKSLLEGNEQPVIAVTEDFVDAGRPPPYARPVNNNRKSEEADVFHPPGGQSLDVEDNATLASSTETLIARFADGHVENVLRDVQDVASSGGGSHYTGSLGGSAPNLFQGGGHDAAQWGNNGDFHPAGQASAPNLLEGGHDVPHWQNTGEFRHDGHGSAPNLFPGGANDAAHWENSRDFHHQDDQVRREQDSKLSEMRRRFRGSGSDSSGKSYDQLMEPPTLEEEERVNRLLREKDEEMRELLTKNREEYDRLYLGKIQDLERECAQFEHHIHALNYRHQQDINALKEESLRLAEEKITEIREEAEKEKEQIQKGEEAKMSEAQIDLATKHENLLQKFIKQQKKEMVEMKEDHIEELAMIKHELNSKHEKQMKELSEKQGVYVLQTRERYEKTLKEERAKHEKQHAEDMRRLKHAMDNDLGDKEKAMMKLAKENYEADLRQLRERLEAENRKVIDDLTKDHMVEIGRAKETFGRDLTEKFLVELDQAVEHTRRESEVEHIRNLRVLEDRLEDTHIQQLQTLQDIKEKHKTTIEDLKRDHKKEIEKLEEEHEGNLKKAKREMKDEHADEIQAVDLSALNEVEKSKKELEVAHKNFVDIFLVGLSRDEKVSVTQEEIDELKNELTLSKSRIVALEAMKSGTETTYMETINSLQEDYENEISKLKGTVDKIKQNQIENLDRTHNDLQNTDQRIIKQNFEQQLSQMKQHYELLMDEMARDFEQKKKDGAQEQVVKYEKKMKEINALYQEDRKMLTDGIAQLGEEHLHEINQAKENIKKLKSEVENLEKKCKEQKDENIGLGNKVRITDDQYHTLVARHERQEQENTKYIGMLSSDVQKCEHAKNHLKGINDRLLQLLSDAVRASMLTEDSINRHLDGLIQETSKTESGVDVSAFRGGANRRSPHGEHSFRGGASSRKSPKKDKTMHGSSFNDATQYSNLSEGSLLSDEGLELSFLSREILFQGPELDQNSEDMIRGVSERLHTAVDHVLKMLSMSTKQATETRQSVDEMLARSSHSEQEQREMREKIAEQLKKALENLEQEKIVKEDWEKEARKKHSDHEVMKKEVAELKKKIETLEKQNAEKDDTLSNVEEKCLELQTEKELLGKLKHELELKLAEVKTHYEKDSHGVRQENEELKTRLARAVQLSGDEFDQVVAEIEDLRENVHALSEDKEALKSQVQDAKEKLSDRGEENERLRENISQTLQSNIELIHQNEALKGKILSVESAFEETLQEQKIAFDRTEASTLDNDFVDGRLDLHQTLDGPSRTETSKLKEDIASLKECVDFLKQENENLCNNLEEKVENELELINKVSELENELYKSANEGFELDKYDAERLLREKKNAELKLKSATRENEKLVQELASAKESLEDLENDLGKAKELVGDRNSLYDELMKFKNVLTTKDEEFSKVKRDAEVVSLALSDKDEEISVISSELSELKDTLSEQQNTINEQHEKIVNLLQKQASDELNEQYIKELEGKIEQERDMLLEKDGEIQILLERLSEEKITRDAAEEQAKAEIVEELEVKIDQQEVEIRRLVAAAEAAEKERRVSEQTHEINLQKALHHVKKEMEKANKLRIAKLKEEHQAEMDRILEMSKLDYSDIGQRFEEQVGAAERVNLQILEHFFKNRGMNDQEATVAADENAPVQSLLNDLQSEAEKIAQLVTSYETASDESANIEELQLSWAKERQVLLEAVKALRQLVARASHTAAVDSINSGQDWRSNLLEAVEEVFRQEHGIVRAEIDTLETIPQASSVSSSLISKKKQELTNQDDFYRKVLNSLDNKDRESLVSEIVHFRRMVDDLQNSVENYQYLLEDFQAKAEMRENDLNRQFDSQMSLVELEKSSASQLRAKLESEQTRNAELELVVKQERAILTDLKTILASDEEKINDLVSSLENERKELGELRSRSKQLVEELDSEKTLSGELQKALEVERKQVEGLTKRETTNAKKLEKLLGEEIKKTQQHTEMINDLTEERNRLEQAAEMERTHTKRIEDLCEELKSKAAHEKSEKQRLEKIAERYHGNLEEMSKLFESEKQRRLENERALNEQRKYRIEAEEKGQTEEMEKEKLEESLKNAKNDVESLKHELERAQEKVTSQEAEIQSENAIKLAETEKQHAEKIKEVLEKAKRNAADDIERERATCIQLRDALKSLQLKYETSRSQLERMKESMDEKDGNQSEREAKAKTSPTSKYSVSSRVMDPFINRCTKLIAHCQDVIVSEQQRMKYGADRPSSRHIKELQSTNDALSALSHEINDLQQDLRALEQGDHTSSSPLARLEQAHNKNEELRDHIRKLVAEKSELRNTLKSLEEQVMQYRNREAELEEAAKSAGEEAGYALKTERLQWQAEREAIQQALDMASVENANLRNGQMKADIEESDDGKLAESGWTLPKIQKLYGRCLRAESFRKALIYQKKYLLFLLGGFQETEAITLSMIAKMDGNSDPAGKAPYGKSRAFMRFRTVARVVVATWRMKFLVKKWNRSVSRAGGKTGGRRSADSKTSPSAPPERAPEKNGSSERFYIPKQTSLSLLNGEGSSDSSSRRNKPSYSSVDAQHKPRDPKKQTRQNGYESRGKVSKENGNVTTRRDRLQPSKTVNDHSNYSSVRNLDLSPPRAYPRPASPRLSRDSPPVLDTDSYGRVSHQSSRARSPRTVETPGKHRRSLSATGLEETNTSLNAYIKKLESLQARLKSQ